MVWVLMLLGCPFPSAPFRRVPNLCQCIESLAQATRADLSPSSTISDCLVGLASFFEFVANAACHGAVQTSGDGQAHGLSDIISPS